MYRNFPAFLLLLALCMPAAAQDEDQDKAPTAQGLVLKIESAGKTDVRSARLLALRVPAGQSPTPFLAPGPFKATWTGALNLPLRSRLVLSVAGRGTIKLTVDDKVLLEGEGEDLSKVEPVRARLGKGANPIVFEYTSPKTGDAWVRLYWDGREFPVEPIPPTVLTHDPTDKMLVQGLAIRRGRQLFATRHCAKCHLPDESFSLGDNTMPELSADAPSLQGIGSRLNAQWIAHWVLDPRQLRPTATMPRLLAHRKGADAVGAKDSSAWDIASFLSAQAAENPAPKIKVATDKATIEEGGKLFAQLGCIGCHTLPDRKDFDKQYQRIPLQYVLWKWKPDALAAFLKQPDKHYKWISMPTFGLSDKEIVQLMAFIGSRSKSRIETEDAPEGSAERGKQLVQKLGCLNCHSLKLDNKAKAPSLSAVMKSRWDKAGCPAGSAPPKAGKVPDFGLSNDQVAALAAFKKKGLDSLKRTTASEVANRRIKLLNCTVCHTRDNLEDRWSKLEPEVAQWMPKPTEVEEFDENAGEPKKKALDQSRPTLTWAGEKLHTKWLGDFVGGRLGYKPRPWLTARMPAFTTQADLIAKGLALEHAVPVAAPPALKPDPALVKIGRKLAGPKGGFSCTACHGVGKLPAQNPFEVEGLNFLYAKVRLRREFYKRWLMNPLRINPRTRMPKYTTDEEDYTSLTDVLEGDSHKQFEAIWHYLQTGKDIKPPDVGQ